jgi:hypothetical protein
MKGILGYTDEKVVATDFRGERARQHLRRRGRHRAGRHLRQAGQLVRQRVGLLVQGAGDGPRDRGEVSGHVDEAPPHARGASFFRPRIQGNAMNFLRMTDLDLPASAC